MSEKIDRRIRDNRVLFTLVVLLSAAVFGGLYLWSRMEVGAPAQPPQATRENVRALAAALEEQLKTMMYFPSGGTLAASPVGIKRQPDTQAQAREAVESLLADQRAGRAAVLKDIRLTAFYLDSSGAAYLSLAPSAQQEVKGSVGDELLAIYALVNTLIQNFEDIKQVHFLFEGKEAQTLAGHIDLSLFFSQRTDLVKQ